LGTEGKDGQRSGSVLERLIRARVDAAREPRPPDPRLLRLQAPLYSVLRRFYFRLEIEGFDRVPDAPSLLVGVHSGGALTMDAWTLLDAWNRHF